MVYGMHKCNRCGSFLSERFNHACELENSNMVKLDRVNFIISVFKELEKKGIQLPIVTYSLIYDVLSDIQEDVELSESMWQTFFQDKDIFGDNEL